MFNAQSYVRLCASAMIAIPGVLITWFLPADSPLRWLAIVMIAWGVAIAILGAFLGIKFAFGRLRLNCPRCHSKSQVIGAQDGPFVIECPKCGKLKIGLVGVSSTHWPNMEEQRTVLEDQPPAEESPLLVPRKYPLAFALVFLPVVAAVVVSSIIYKFSFFYLLIPGAWCFGVSCFLINDIANRKTPSHSRPKSPLALLVDHRALGDLLPLCNGVPNRARSPGKR